MYFPPPAEPLAHRLIASLRAGNLHAWASRIFDPAVVLHDSDGRGHSGLEAVASTLRAELAGRTMTGIQPTEGDGSIVICFGAPSSGRRLRLSVEGHKIIEGWLCGGGNEDRSASDLKQGACDCNS